MALRALPVPDGLAGERVDAGLARLLGVSRTRAAELAEAGQVMLDGASARKSDRLVAGAWLEVEVPEAREIALEPTPVPGMEVVFDDTDIVVVDKPVGVAAHPSAGWEGPTVVGALAAAGYRIATSGAQERQGIVSRLDVGTSGLMLVCKSEIAYSRMRRAFAEREVEKTYHALAQGHPEPPRGTVDAPIGRHPGHEWKFAVVADGRHAVTHYETVEALPGAALLKVGLETGRTHQIRVHMAAIRHPLVGDTFYGADPTLASRLGLERQWLHAQSLGFEHPTTGEWTVVTSRAYPDDLAHALAVLRQATFRPGDE